MVALLGMAGLAEAAEASALMLGYGGLLLIGFTAVIGVLARSRIAAAVAVLLLGLLTMLYQPWWAFEPYESTDSDVHYWVAEWRGFARWWAFAVAAVLIALIRAFTFTRRTANSQAMPPDPGR